MADSTTRPARSTCCPRRLTLDAVDPQERYRPARLARARGAAHPRLPRLVAVSVLDDRRNQRRDARQRERPALCRPRRAVRAVVVLADSGTTTNTTVTSSCKQCRDRRDVALIMNREDAAASRGSSCRAGPARSRRAFRTLPIFRFRSASAAPRTAGRAGAAGTAPRRGSPRPMCSWRSTRLPHGFFESLP